MLSMRPSILLAAACRMEAAFPTPVSKQPQRRQPFQWNAKELCTFKSVLLATAIPLRKAYKQENQQRKNENTRYSIAIAKRAKVDPLQLF